MEDEDEFGDLYTDVFRLPPPSAAPQPLPSRLLAPSPKPFSSFLQTREDDGDDEDDDFIYGARVGSGDKPHSETLAPQPNRRRDEGEERDRRSEPFESASASEKDLNWDDGAAFGGRTLERESVSQRNEVVTRVSEGPAAGTGAEVSGSVGKVVLAEVVGKNAVYPGQKMQLDVEDGDLDAEPVIPGLSRGPYLPFQDADEMEEEQKVDAGGGAGGGGDDWDTDSEDDLQIVLNDNIGINGARRKENMGSEDEDDEDGEDLVIVADDGAPLCEPVEEQDWGEETAPSAGEAERKDGNEPGKVNGVPGGAVGARIGYSNHSYHPHHLQFKYVRPGAVVPPGGVAANSAAPGQVRPVVLTTGSGRGRGDWRPMGMKNLPPGQKNFHQGYGPSGWANNSAARPLGSGLEFTLPSHKTIFDIDIDNFEEKPWKYPGVDISDYFNFGLDEDQWKEYCKQLDQTRLEATMQSKIRVYESGRSEQDYDPDLPPELAAAAGLHDASTENANLGKTDGGQRDVIGQGRIAPRIRPPLPTGRAIQVEAGYGERLPSIDTRPPRNRDSDAVIEIICHDPENDDSVTSNGAFKSQNETEVENFRGNCVIDEDNYVEQYPSNSDSRKRDKVKNQAPSVGCAESSGRNDNGLPCQSETVAAHPSGSRMRSQANPVKDFGPPQGKRCPQGSMEERDSQIDSNCASHKNENDGQQSEKSKDSSGSKQVSKISSPEEVEAVRELSIDPKDDSREDQLTLANSVEAEGDEITSGSGVPSGTLDKNKVDNFVRKQKLSSRVEAASSIENGDDTKPVNSEARSGSSKEYKRKRDGGEEEVIQDRHLRRTGDGRSLHDTDEQSYQTRDDYGWDGRREADRSQSGTKTRLEQTQSHPTRDSNSGHHLRVRGEGLERHKDNSSGIRQRRDEDIQRRRTRDEDTTRRHDRVEETASRHRNRARESERSEKNDHMFPKKNLDDGDWRGQNEKDAGSNKHRERDDNAVGRPENLDNPHLKGKKEKGLQKREPEKDERLYRGREDRRKRERDDGLDSRRDQPGQREKPDDHHQAIRHREESWRQREKEDRQRVKQVHEESKWVGSGRTKDEPNPLGSDKDYSHRDKRQRAEQPKRRDRLEEEPASQHRVRDDNYSREIQHKNEERYARHERSSSQNERLAGSYKERHKETMKRNKETDVGDQNPVSSDRRKHDEHGTHKTEKVNTKNKSEQENGTVSKSFAAEVSKKGHQPQLDQLQHSSRKHGAATVDEDLLQGSRKGRSKLERWTSHKERGDVNLNRESGSSDGGGVGTEQPDETEKLFPTENNEKTGQSSYKDTDASAAPASDDQIVDSQKAEDGRHLDTVAKLKKRSERFKLPMPSEKDTNSKRVENEAVATQNENAPGSEIKQERPARKRRWVSG